MLTLRSAALSMTVASHGMEKTLYQIPQKLYCHRCSMLREEGRGMTTLKSYSNLHIYVFVFFSPYAKIKLNSPNNYFLDLI